ncbi:XdhC family protein [Streptomyces spinosirectus]|uniref:XdhC family protein n=1 Tax=Streptomyces TaxID=1883 RepID=UPI001C9DC57C|nr:MULTISPECIES: XdhC family protein [Streptomyces]MBY8344669.1 XdhC family protein [Streptomyces plumbidurans]UIR22230.1 XdhC family protein [Streptomyces spinosirectus]
MTGTVSARALELARRRVPFVHARVVRAQAPASAHPGDEAIVHGDGTIDGFVGGQCAEGSVRTAALGALHGGGPLLLRVLPAGEDAFPDAPGAQVVVNPCLSGGALEIFLEPVLPPPLVEVSGNTPIAEAFVALARVLGYATARSLPGGRPAEHTAAVVVAGQGHGDAESLRAALDADIPYIALVASRRRGSALLDELGLDETEKARIHSPAGLDIGARTAPEIALSILAEVVEAVRARPHVPPPAPPAEAVDPVCGMTVTVTPGTPHLTTEDGELWFCGTGCRDRHAAGLVG